MTRTAYAPPRARRTHVAIVAAVLALGFAPSAGRSVRAEDAPKAAAKAPLIPRAILFGNPERSGPKISPDGKRLGFLKADENGIVQVWVSTIGAKDDKQATKSARRSLREWFWGHDSASVFYMVDNGGDENDHLWRVDLATGEPLDLTPFPGVKCDVAAFERETPGEIVVGLNRRTKSAFDLWRIDLASKAVTLLEENPGSVVASILDRQHRLRAAVFVNPKGGNEIRVREGEAWRTVVASTAQDRVEPDTLSADGKTLYVRSDLGSDTRALVAIDLATGERTVVASDPGVDVGRTLFDETTGRPQAASFDRERPRWQVIDPAVKDDFAALDGLAGRAGFSITSSDDADKTWVVALVGDTVAPRFVLWRRDTKKVEPLFSVQSALDGAVLAPVRAVDVPARDGLAVPTLVTLPPGVEPKALPTVMLVHGGPWARDRWGFDPQAQWLANRGYAVLQVNYRGSTGFGKKHMLAGRREFAGKMHTDLLDALAWAVKEGTTDPKRVAIMGGSYGGYATLVGLAFTPDVFACGVDIVGPSNLVSLIESFPPYWRASFVNNWYPFVGDPSKPEERKDMEARSPLFKVDQIKAPLLVGQGANDPRVTKKESDQIVEAIKARGGIVEYVVYPDEGHGFQNAKNRLDFYARAEAFLAKHLGGRAE